MPNIYLEKAKDLVEDLHLETKFEGYLRLAKIQELRTANMIAYAKDWPSDSLLDVIEDELV